MALVSLIKRGDKEKLAVHKPTRCLYSVIELEGNERFLQLDTYGSDEREHPEKISQSIQFDKAGATELVALIRLVFPELF